MSASACPGAAGCFLDVSYGLLWPPLHVHFPPGMLGEAAYRPGPPEAREDGAVEEVKPEGDVLLLHGLIFQHLGTA